MIAPLRAPILHGDPRPTFRERRRHLRLVREARRRPRRHRRILAVTFVGLAAFTLFGILVVHVRLAQTAFELQGEQQALERRRDHAEQLRIATAELEAPERIRRIATERLGMVEPTVIHFLYVDSPEADPEASSETSLEANLTSGHSPTAPPGD